MDDKEYAIEKLKARNELIKSLLAVASTVVALIAVIITVQGFAHSAHLQTSQQIVEAKLDACQKVAEKAAALYAATTQEEFDRAEEALEETKHGTGMLMLNQDTLSALNQLVRYAQEVELPDDENFQSSVIEHGICNLPLIVTAACRAELAESFKSEAEGAPFQPIANVNLQYQCQLPPLSN